MKNRKQPLQKYLCLPFYPDLCLIHTYVSYEEFSNSLSKEIGSEKIPCNSLALGNVIYCSLTLGNYCVSSIKTTLEAACKLPSYFATKAPIEDAYELAGYLFTNGPIYAQNTFESSLERMNKIISHVQKIDYKPVIEGFVSGAVFAIDYFSYTKTAAYELAGHLITNVPIYAQNTFESGKELLSKVKAGFMHHGQKIISSIQTTDYKAATTGFVVGAILDKLPYFDPLIKIGAGIAAPLFSPAKASFILGEVLGAAAAEAASPTFLWNVAKCGTVTVVASACIGTASAIYFNREEISDKIYSMYEHIMGATVTDVLGADQAGSHTEEL